MANRHELSQPRPLPNPGWGPLAALPGNPLMWVLILSEIVVFAAFFGLFAWLRAGEREVFDASQQLLDPVIGGINTMGTTISTALTGATISTDLTGLGQ